MKKIIKSINFAEVNLQKMDSFIADCSTDNIKVSRTRIINFLIKEGFGTYEQRCIVAEIQTESYKKKRIKLLTKK